MQLAEQNWRIEQRREISRVELALLPAPKNTGRIIVLADSHRVGELRRAHEAIAGMFWGARISLQEAFDRDLKVLDATAFALARENSMPIIVFSIEKAGAIEQVLRGRGRSTVVGG